MNSWQQSFAKHVLGVQAVLLEHRQGAGVELGVKVGEPLLRLRVVIALGSFIDTDPVEVKSPEKSRDKDIGSRDGSDGSR